MSINFPLESADPVLGSLLPPTVLVLHQEGGEAWSAIGVHERVMGGWVLMAYHIRSALVQIMSP
jgi:hypothetical protein